MLPLLPHCIKTRLSSLVLIGLFPLSLWAVETPAHELESAWQLGAQGLFTEAAQAMPEKATGEETAFTRAVLLLNRQPRTEEDMKTAIQALRDLGHGGATAEIRARSLYYAACAASLQTRGQSSSGESFAQLWQDYPEEPYGQRALVHLMLLAFDSEEPKAVVLTHCDELEDQAKALTDPMVRSHFHQVAARGYLYLGGEAERALAHLLQVHEVGVARRETLGDLHVSIGQLAAELGRSELAQKHYREFLRLFPNDPRVYTINANLHALPHEPNLSEATQ